MALDKGGTRIFSGEPSPSYEIWISEVDSSGAGRDGRVVEAARKMRDFFLHYRQSELGCPSLANTLAEQAVDKVSEALKQGAIEYHSYLKTAFMHLVNRYPYRERRLVSVDFARDDERVPEQLVSEAEVRNLERLIQIKQILTVMDPQTLSVFAARRAGYSGKQIADRLGITTNALYTSYCRGLARVIEVLGVSSAAVRDNQQVHGSERQGKRRQEKARGVLHPKHP
jgi:hypothetical protein